MASKFEYRRIRDNITCIFNVYNNIMLYLSLYCTSSLSVSCIILYYFYDRTDFFSFDDDDDDDARICKIRGRALNNGYAFIADETRLSDAINPMSDVCFIVTSVRHAMCSYIESDPLQREAVPFYDLCLFKYNIYYFNSVYLNRRAHPHFYRILFYTFHM